MKKGIQLVALLLTVVMSSCTGGKDKAAVKQEDEKPRVKVADVTARPVDQIQDYTATVEAEVKNNIAPSSPVRIDRILVEVGDRVSKGQKLVQMDAANLTQTKLQLDNQKIEFNRIDELYKVGGASKSEWDAAKMQLDVKQTAYNNLVENTFLLSPINGVITARNYDNGDMYSGGSPVLVVEQITPVKLMINVSETYFTKVKKGEPVDVKLDVQGNYQPDLSDYRRNYPYFPDRDQVGQQRSACTSGNVCPCYPELRYGGQRRSTRLGYCETGRFRRSLCVRL